MAIWPHVAKELQWSCSTVQNRGIKTIGASRKPVVFREPLYGSILMMQMVPFTAAVLVLMLQFEQLLLARLGGLLGLVFMERGR